MLPTLPDTCQGPTHCPSVTEVPGTARELGSVGSQPNHTLAWSQASAPPAGFGSGGGIIANSSSGSAVAFGGVRSAVLVNSTFVYTEATDRWTAVSTPQAPTPRSDFAFAFDSTTGTAVLFGGLTNLTTLVVSNETWIYRVGSSLWTPSTPGPAPPAREGAAFSIDPSLGVGILYGGWDRNFSGTGSLTYSDLWELNLSTGAWSNVSVPGPRPPPLEGAAMAWDPQADRMDMFGGCYPCTSSVWQFDPTSLRWTDLASTSSAPTPRGAASWSYDPLLRADLLFGGSNGGATFNDTQIFSPANDSWVTQTLSPVPAARSNAVSAFLNVSGNETWLLAGGLSGSASYSDLWRLSATSNVSLRVVNASSPSSPVGGALLNLSGRRAGATDAAGYLNLTQVNVVGALFNVTDVPWFFPDNQTLWMPPGRPESVTVELTPEPLGTVSVHVVSNGGSPVAAVFVNLTVDDVRINLVPSVTNGTGNASFFGVPPGRTNVTAENPVWRTASVRGILAPGGTLRTTVTMVPDPVLTVTVLGHVPNISLVPLNAAKVLLNGTIFGFTDSDGLFTGVTPALGVVPLIAEASGFYPETTFTSIPFTGPASATVVLASLPYGVLAVTVLRSNDSLPIVGATVSVFTTVPLSFGNYALSNETDNWGTAGFLLPPGTYAVSALATAYFPSSNVVVNVSSGPNLPVTILLVPLPLANVHLIVRDRITGAPISGAYITTSSSSVSYRSNAWGYANATNLTPGPYLFEVSAYGYLTNSTEQTLNPKDNRTVIVNLTLAPGYSEIGPPEWAFELFPGSLDQLWPFLLVPLLLVVGGFLLAAVLRGAREEEETTSVSGAVGPDAGARSAIAGGSAESSPPPPPGSVR